MGQSTIHERHSNAAMPRTLQGTGLPHVHLKISEGIVTRRDMLISTVLGSCVSVTFFHQQTKLTGIFHAMLPEQAMMRNAAGQPPCKFVDSAITLVEEEFSRKNVELKDVDLKLFGGAFSMNNGKSDAMRGIVDVGGKNIAMARHCLQQRGLSLLSEHVGGTKGRKLVMDTRTGEVWMKLLHGNVPQPHLSQN